MSILGKQWIEKNRTLAELLQHVLDDASVMPHDPFLFRDMEKAVKRLEKAIQAGERVMIFGDYDVDGISGTAILVHTLRELGANVSYRLPNRDDGYGMNPKWIEEFKQVGVDILITVDCGISNSAEIAAAKQADIDVIITDHHALPRVLPEAYATLHPALPGGGYPFHELSGSAVAYKLGIGLMQHLCGEEAAHEWQTKTADLASLGTVADCVPLVGENRWIVKAGLDQLRQTAWPGLKILLEKAGINEIVGYNSDLIGFRIGPRLNASGRLETPYYSLQLLLNENGAAENLADKLETLNHSRRERVEKAIKETEAQISDRLDQKVLIAWSDAWSAGIIGLLAAKLSEKYNRPAIVMHQRKTEFVASCRSIDGFHMVEALQTCADHFTSFGGHAAAAGFTLPLKNLARFLEDIQTHAQNTLTAKHLTPTLILDFSVELHELTLDLARQLATLEPFGEGNPRPCFVLRNVNPINLQTVGHDHRHLRFQLGEGHKRLSAIAFRLGEHMPMLQRAIYDQRPVDVAFELERDVWQGKERLQLKVVDMRVV